MAIVIVGGHSRSVGKTSVVSGLIAALPEMHWTAIKVTQYGHGICSADGEPCDCATDDHSWAVNVERSHAGDSDTSRFLVAGADKVYWARTRQGYLAEAMPRLRQILAESANVIVESNSMMKFIRPDIYLSVLDYDTRDFKPSAREFLDRATAVIVHAQGAQTVPAWDDVSLKLISGKPVFAIEPPRYITPELVDFVRQHLVSAVAR
jgi:molybdopterin-guanine dinucleotide biosynthesis protein